MGITPTKPSAYTTVTPDAIARDIIVNAADIAVMVPPGDSTRERLAKCNKAELKTIAAELDTLQRRLEYLLFWGV